MIATQTLSKYSTSLLLQLLVTIFLGLWPLPHLKNTLPQSLLPSSPYLVLVSLL